MNTITKISIGLISLAISSSSFALYGPKICNKPGFSCHKVQRGETWSSLFPNEEERNLVKRLNRMNIGLTRGMVIAVPDNLENITIMDISPFPLHIEGSSRNVIKVDQSKLAWGAYNTSGDLVRWGPASGGQDFCPDIRRGCHTVTGTFTVYNAQGPGCRSSVYPKPHGGAPMPYCMHFFKGYALHGSNNVPGRNASHGCVRLFTEDARWLNQEFVTPGQTQVNVKR